MLVASEERKQDWTEVRLQSGLHKGSVNPEGALQQVAATRALAIVFAIFCML